MWHSSILQDITLCSHFRFHSQRTSTPHYCDHFQMENLQRNAAQDRRLPAAHTHDWSEDFPLGTTGKHGNMERKCLACLPTLVSGPVTFMCCFSIRWNPQIQAGLKPVNMKLQVLFRCATIQPTRTRLRHYPRIVDDGWGGG